MEYAYTPGLKRAESYIVRKTRKLPIPGKVLVQPGDAVSPETVIAEAIVPGDAQIVRVSSILGIDPDQLEAHMLKKEKEEIKKDEIIAAYKAFFGLINRACQSPIEGSIELISNVTGQVVIRGIATSIAIKAYIPEIVVKVLPEQGAIIECHAAYIQGIFGIGGETHGELMLLSDSPDSVLTEKEIGSDCVGKILVAGALVTAEALNKAVKVGAKGVITGGIEDKDLTSFLGYEVGVAITGNEIVGLTLIVLEGFSNMPVSGKTFEILRNLNGKRACINGATQIRAGVIRPEIIIPHDGSYGNKSFAGAERDKTTELKQGVTVRIIRKPYFGHLGRIVSLPIEPQVVESESKVRVLTVKLEDGREVTVPRANVEAIEE
jgi:hypothetical protein